jgi:hypothetical protein
MENPNPLSELDRSRLKRVKQPRRGFFQRGFFRLGFFAPPAMALILNKT